MVPLSIPSTFSSTETSLDRLSTSTNVTEWLDSELTLGNGNPPDNDRGNSNLDSKVTSLRNLSTTLSSCRSSTRLQIDQLIGDLVTTVPRVSVDLSLLNESAKSLSSRIHLIHDQHEHQGVGHKHEHEKEHENEGSDYLERITRLSQLKTAMVAARNTLREQQAWSTIDSEVAAFVSDKRWQDAVNRITKARQSLTLLPNTEKQNRLQQLTNDVEVNLQQQIQNNVAERQLIEIAHWLEQLGNSNGFFNTYFNVRGQPAVERWKTANHSMSPKQNLTALLDSLTQLVDQERDVSTRLFQQPRQTVEALLAHTIVLLQQQQQAAGLLGIQANMDDVDQQADQKAAWLVDSYSQCLGFIQAIEKHHLPDPDLAGPTDAVVFPSTVSSSWKDELLAPFLKARSEFETLESKALTLRFRHVASLSRLPSFTSCSVSVELETLQSKISLLETEYSISVSRFQSLFSSPPPSTSTSFLSSTLTFLVSDILSQTLTSYTNLANQRIQSVIQRCRKQVYLSSSSSTTTATTTTTTTITEDKDSLTSDDWNFFRSSLDLITYLSLLYHSNPNPNPSFSFLFPSNSEQLIQLSNQIHTFLYQLILLAPLTFHLEKYSTLDEIWKSISTTTITNQFDLVMPTFSLSPTDQVSFISEYLLTLPRWLDEIFSKKNQNQILFGLHPSPLSKEEEESNLITWLTFSITKFFQSDFGPIVLSISKKKVSKLGKNQLDTDLQYLDTIYQAIVGRHLDNWSVDQIGNCI